MKYGYNSPTAFNRAFQNIHGIAPSIAREKGTMLRAYSPISFKITIKGAEEMNYRIEKKEAFRIIGVSQPLQKEVEKNFEIVPQMWGNAAMDGTIETLASMIKAEPMGVLGVSACMDEDKWNYFIAVASNDELQEPFDEYIVPSFTWAIFSGAGQCPQAIQELEQQIVRDWLPTSGYEYDNGPDIELYLNPDPQDAKFEVWIPVRKQGS